MRVIAINNMKGGVGKTTLSTHIASVMALDGDKVLIVDTDSQGNVSSTFNILSKNLEYTLYDVLVDDLPPEMAIINVYSNKTGGSIDILPSNSSLFLFAEKMKGRFNVLHNKLQHLKKEYDYIIIDTPPSISSMFGNILVFAEGVIIPFQPERYARESIVEVLKNIRDFEELNPKLTVLGLVTTMVDSKTNLHVDMMENTRSFCMKTNIHIFDTAIPRSIRYASNVGYEGKPLILSKPKDKLSKIYKQLWEEIKCQIQKTEH